ncbi:MAG: hypothetical protein GY853_01620 [PVC group bacterium]|nr:hypothetical protein [PVC group bacterium]
MKRFLITMVRNGGTVYEWTYCYKKQAIDRFNVKSNNKIWKEITLFDRKEKTYLKNIFKCSHCNGYFERYKEKTNKINGKNYCLDCILSESV